MLKQTRIFVLFLLTRSNCISLSLQDCTQYFLIPKTWPTPWSTIWSNISPKSGHVDLVFETSLYVQRETPANLKVNREANYEVNFEVNFVVNFAVIVLSGKCIGFSQKLAQTIHTHTHITAKFNSNSLRHSHRRQNQLCN